MRAGIHWAVGAGLEQDVFTDGMAIFKEKFPAEKGHEMEFENLGGADPYPLPVPACRMRYSFGDCLGFAEGWAEKGVEPFEPSAPPDLGPIKEAGAEVHIFAATKDLTTDFDMCLAKLREENPEGVLALILLAEDFDGLGCKNMTMHLHQYIENVDLCVFATSEDKEKVESVFLSKSITSVSGMNIAQAMIAFPRLHFFSLMGEDEKTCGQEIKEKSLLFSTCGIGESSPWAGGDKITHRAFVFENEGKDPIHYVPLPGDSKATVVMCAHVITDILKKAVENGCDESGMEATEAESNVNDLVSEFQQYCGEYCWEDAEEE
jgi:hypothetical protein